jgi:hypothetical protein
LLPGVVSIWNVVRILALNLGFQKIGRSKISCISVLVPNAGRPYMLRRNAFLVFVGLLLIIPVVNCGGPSHVKPVISGTLPNGNVDVPYSGTLTVTGGVAPFTANVTGLPASLTSAVTGNTITISGTPLATATISGMATVTDSNMTSSLAFPFSFTIGPTPALVITPTSFNLMVGTQVNQALTVNPATIGPYTWTITSGVLPPGTPTTTTLLLSNGTTTDPKTIQTTTNTVTITGTPGMEGNFPFIIQVTDSAATPNSAQASYTGFVSNSNAQACPTGNNNAGLPAGTSYAFLLRGFDATDDEPIVIAGSFTANGIGGIGGVTAANVDYNGVTLGPQNPGSNMNLAASSYSFSLENGDTRGCLSLVFNTDPAANRVNAHKSQALPARSTSLRARRANSLRSEQVAPTTPTRVIFRFALGGQNSAVPPLFTTGNIIEFDNGDGSTDSWATGVMHLQDPTTFKLSSLAANFAFGLAGWDPSVNRAALAGSFANAGGAISSVFADFNDNGTASGELTGGSGMINTVDTTTGRATASFDVPITGSPDLKFDAVIYVINANDFYVLSTDQVSTGTPNTPLVSGRALATPGTFTSTALNGFFLAAAEGFDALNFANVVTIGTAQFSSTGTTATASFTSNDFGTVTNPTFTGTYTVDTTNPSSGRVSLNPDSGTITQPPVIYLTSGGDGIEQIQGFSVGTDANVGSGVLVTQSAAAPAFTSSNVAGTYALGNWEDVDGQNGSISGVTTLTATTGTAGTYTSVFDINYFSPPKGSQFLSPNANPGFSGPFTFTINLDGTGTSTLPIIDCLTAPTTPCTDNSSAFVTNGPQIFAIPTGSNVDGILYTFTNVTLP